MAELFDILTYDTVKVTDVLDIGEIYANVATLVTPSREAGLYEIKFTGTVQYPDVNDLFYIRWRVDAGAWYEFRGQQDDQDSRIPITYFYPQQFAAGSHTVEIEMRKESGGSQLDLLFLDTVFHRVG